MKGLLLKPCLIKTGLYLVLIASVLLPLYNVLHIYPAFERELIKVIEVQAIRIANHLSSMIQNTYGQSLNRGMFGHDFQHMAQEVKRDFNLWKLKVFSAKGEVLYSTDPEDIGSVNRHSYFFDTVAKGKVFSILVSKDATTMEGQKVNTDIVETYVPLMKEGEFLGAFEVYYNITETKRGIDLLNAKYSSVMFFIGLLSIGLALMLIRGYNFMVSLKEALLTEVNERRKAEDDLNRAQEVAKTGSWRLDIMENRLYWSKETYRMFGIEEGTPLTYEAFLETVHLEDRELVDKAWKAALRGEPYEIEHRIVTKGTIKWVNEKAEVSFNQQGDPVFAIGTVQDITDRKASEMDRQRIYEELQSAYNDLKRFQDLSLQREERMIELKREVNTLLQRLGEPPRYDVAQ